MNALTTDRIRGHATRLGLTHLTETITALVERAETAQLGYLEFVDLLLEEEVGLRESRRFRNALKLSCLLYTSSPRCGSDSGRLPARGGTG